MGVNGKRDKTRNIIFQRKIRNREKTGEKHKKERKRKKKQEMQKQDKIRFQRVKISARQDFNKISGNAENKNNVFSNVTKRRFESKNKDSVQAY